LADGRISLDVLQSYDVTSRPENVQKAYAATADPGYPRIPTIVVLGTADREVPSTTATTYARAAIDAGKQENTRLYFVKGATHAPTPLEIPKIGFQSMFSLILWVEFGVPPGDLNGPLPFPVPQLPAGCEIPNSLDAGFEHDPEGYVEYILSLPDCV
jgi:hypothetical protein